VSESDGKPSTAENIANSLKNTMDDRSGWAGDGSGRGVIATGSSLLLFVFGVGIGVFVTFSGNEFIASNLATILSGFLVAAGLIAVVGLVTLVFRRAILRYLFQVTNTQLEQIAAPLASVAHHAANRDTDAAVDAARSFAQIALARWSWLSTRRWIIASLTALIAALAALAGTSLLFRQNELLAEQSVLLGEQTQRLSDQNRLIDTDIQLAEAARSAQLLSENAIVADLLGRATQDQRDAGKIAPFDPETDLPPGLINRIVSVSLAARAYRYLNVAKPLQTARDAWIAAAPRRPELAGLQAAFKPDAARTQTSLIADPVSPERGQLLALLFYSDVIATEYLSLRGADFSFAQVRIPVLALASYQFARLSQADFRNIRIIQSRFRAATLYKTVFENTVILDSDFSAIPGAEVEPPFAKRPEPARTGLTGASFANSAVMKTTFSGAYAQLTDFDRAFLADVSFAQAELSAATFRQAVLLDVDFTGAELRAIDLEGAYVFSETFLSDIAAQAATGTFKLDRWALEKASLDDVNEIDAAFDHIGVEIDIDRVQGRGVWRILRVGEFQ